MANERVCSRRLRSAVALVAIDGAASEATLAAIQSLPGVKRLVAMKF